jgi:hypothetical protein
MRSQVHSAAEQGYDATGEGTVAIDKGTGTTTAPAQVTLGGLFRTGQTIRITITTSAGGPTNFDRVCTSGNTLAADATALAATIGANATLAATAAGGVISVLAEGAATTVNIDAAGLA